MNCHYSKKLIRLACPLAAVLLACGPAAAADKFPFRAGEKLHYAVYWTQIEAAEATLEILPMEKLDGAMAWHFTMIARTTPMVEKIYPVLDRMDAWTDAEITHALQYKERRETRKIKDVTVTFDWKAQKVQYAKKGKKRQPLELMAGAFDPLSIFYFFRSQELKENAEITRPVSDGKKCVMGKAHVRSRQKVTAAGKEYDTFLVEPELTGIGGVFEKSPGAKLQIWVTADKRRLPVLVKSQVAVGSFTAELDTVTYK